MCERLMQSGISIGAGAGAASALHSVLTRVVCTRGAAGGLVMLKIVGAVWGKDADPGAAYDLQATLLRLALPLLQMLSARHTHHAFPLYESIGESAPVLPVCRRKGLRGVGLRLRARRCKLCTSVNE